MNPSIAKYRGALRAFEVAEDLQVRLWAARRRVAELNEEEALRDTCNDIRADIAMAQRIQAERDVDFLEAALSDALAACRPCPGTYKDRAWAHRAGQQSNSTE